MNPRRTIEGAGLRACRRCCLQRGREEEEARERSDERRSGDGGAAPALSSSSASAASAAASAAAEGCAAVRPPSLCGVGQVATCEVPMRLRPLRAVSLGRARGRGRASTPFFFGTSRSARARGDEELARGSRKWLARYAVR